MPCRVDCIPCKYNCGLDNCDLSNYPCQNKDNKKSKTKNKIKAKKAKLSFNERENYSNLLYEACVLLEQFGQMPGASQELKNWFNNESQDMKRVKEVALAKLSSKEKKALGFYGL